MYCGAGVSSNVRFPILASMPGVVQVKVVSAHELPIMNRDSKLTNAFVEVQVGQCGMIPIIAHHITFSMLHNV